MINKLIYRLRKFKLGILDPIHLRLCSYILKTIEIKKYTTAELNRDNEVGIAFLDLDSVAMTYNVFEFLELAEHELIFKGCSSAEIVVLTSSRNFLSVYETTEYAKTFGSASREWRLWNIIIPAISLYPYFKKISITKDRTKVSEYKRDVIIFPENYHPSLIKEIDVKKLYTHYLISPDKLRGITVPFAAKEQIGKFIEKYKLNQSKIVTVTIRAQQYDPARNTNLEAWNDLATWLDSHKFKLVVVPDADSLYSIPYERYANLSPLIKKEFCFNIQLRAALYETAFINFFVNNGPSILSTFNRKSSYVIMNFLSEGSVVTNKDQLKALGHLKYEDRLPWAKNNQKICRHPESLDTLIDQFKSFLS